MGYFRFHRRATVNISKRGVTGTAGLPGSGISYRTSPHHLGAQNGPQRRRSSRRPLSHSSARHGFWQQLRAILYP